MRVLVHICCGPCAITVLQRLMDAGHDPVGLFFNPNIQPLAEYLRRREGAAQVTEKLGVPLILADALPLAEQAWAAEAVPSFPGRAFGSESRGQPARGSSSFSVTDNLLPDLSTPVTPAISSEGAGSGEFYIPLPDLPPAVNPLPWLRAVAGNEGRRCLFCWGIRLRKTVQLALARNFEAFTTSLLYSRYQDHDRIRAMGEHLAASGGPFFIYQDFRTSWRQGIDLSKEWGIYRQQYCGCLYSEYDRYALDCRKICGGE